MRQAVKQFIVTIVARILLWCFRNNTNANETFNSIRINALTTELVANGIVDPDRVNAEIYKSTIYIINGKRGVEGV